MLPTPPKPPPPSPVRRPLSEPPHCMHRLGLSDLPMQHSLLSRE